MKSNEYGLFENAIDSLAVGIFFYQEYKDQMAHKHAILNIFHSIELLLKERLFREDPILIYRVANKLFVKENSVTIGFDECLKRFRSIGINLSNEELKAVRALKNKRNFITHHKFIPNEIEDENILGLSLQFIGNFLENHLDTRLKDEIQSELYYPIEEIVDSFEKRYLRATKQAEDMVTPKTKDDLCDPKNLAECPECGTETMACAHSGGYCTMCEGSFDIQNCPGCGNFTAHLDNMGQCSDCTRNLMLRIDNE